MPPVPAGRCSATRKLLAALPSLEPPVPRAIAPGASAIAVEELRNADRSRGPLREAQAVTAADGVSFQIRRGGPMGRAMSMPTLTDERRLLVSKHVGERCRLYGGLRVSSVRLLRLNIEGSHSAFGQERPCAAECLRLSEAVATF